MFASALRMRTFDISPSTLGSSGANEAITVKELVSAIKTDGGCLRNCFMK
ncbi:MAG: hypothetical protein HY201_04215 [Nitrospirae bacterium]|nr:hypothetical protein [Candidatus Troglogloeales bacterium]MBI3598636.1 hypothetical protein [Candidatus Troglogloeales bacterium]